MSDPAVFKSSLSRGRIEAAYSLVLRIRDANDVRSKSFTETGMRAARARDAKLLIALEAMAEQTGKMQEEQVGRLMRSPDATFGESRGTTEHQLCREAYRMVDQGTPVPHLVWIYAVAAVLCGYIV